jgi:hypothetical protein
LDDPFNRLPSVFNMLRTPAPAEQCCICFESASGPPAQTNVGLAKGWVHWGKNTHCLLWWVG